MLKNLIFKHACSLNVDPVFIGKAFLSRYGQLRICVEVRQNVRASEVFPHSRTHLITKINTQIRKSVRLVSVHTDMGRSLYCLCWSSDEKSLEKPFIRHDKILFNSVYTLTKDVTFALKTPLKYTNDNYWIPHLVNFHYSTCHWLYLNFKNILENLAEKFFIPFTETKIFWTTFYRCLTLMCLTCPVW